MSNFIEIVFIYIYYDKMVINQSQLVFRKIENQNEIILGMLSRIP